MPGPLPTSPARPELSRHVPRRPRRARSYRRGLAGLSTVIFAAAGLAMALAAWQLQEAQARLDGTARSLADTVAAEAYGLHHWLHRERADGTLPNDPGPDDARRLSAAEDARLADHGATAPWRRDGPRSLAPRGWAVVSLIGPEGQGVVVLRPATAVTGSPTWPALTEALDATLGESDGATLARRALTDFDPGTDRALRAPRFARLDTNAVLRQTHAGHVARAMETDIDMAGSEIMSAGRLEADAVQARVGITRSVELTSLTVTEHGTVAVTGGAALDQLEIIDTLSVPGSVSGLRQVRTGTMDVTGDARLTRGAALLACANTGADLCDGGALDLRAATGAPDWDEATVFGDVVFSATPGRIEAQRVRAREGIFRTFDPDHLRVTGCLRSVTPFIYGARC